MYRPIVITNLEDLPRFAAAGGQLLRPEVVARQTPRTVPGSWRMRRARRSPVAHSGGGRRRLMRADHRLRRSLCRLRPAGGAGAAGRRCERLAAEGCTLAVGPVDGNTWQRYRLITGAAASRPSSSSRTTRTSIPASSPPPASSHWRSTIPRSTPTWRARTPRLPELTRRVADRGITVQPLRPERFDEDMRRVHALSLVSFRDNFLYSPIGEAEFLAQYALIRPHMRPDLVLLAERQGTLVGFIFAIPDLLRAQRGQPMDTVIIKTMAVHPEHGGIGLGSLLMARCEQAARAAGFTRAIHALFHEANRSGRISGHTAQVIRRYTLFARRLRAGVGVGGRPDNRKQL